MPPKRKTVNPTATTSAATAGTSTTNPSPRRRGRPPIVRNYEANVSHDQPQPKRQRMATEDVEASQDSEPQSLSERTQDVEASSQAQDISKDYIQSAISSDLAQKEPHLPLSHHDKSSVAPADGEDDGELSTGLREETSESPAKKTRGVVQRRGKGILPATRSSPRKQIHQHHQTRQQQQQQQQQHQQDGDTKTTSMNESFLRSSQPPPASSSPALSLASSSTLPLSLRPVPVPMPGQQDRPAKRKRGRPPKVTTALPSVVADSQSSDQPADISKPSKQTRSIAISIATAAATSGTIEGETSAPMDSSAVGAGSSTGDGDGSGGGSGTGPIVDHDDNAASTTIVPSQVVSVSPQTTTALDNITQQQQQEIPRLPSSSPEHHHQTTVSPTLDITTHAHTHPHIHPHPSSLYPPSMPYAYAYAHHGAPGGHYPFPHHPPPPPAGRPYPSSASESGGGIDYSPSFASTVPTTPASSFTSTYPHHPHPHAILDPNAPHGNPFPPPGAGHIVVPNYAQNVYAIPAPMSSPVLSGELDERERHEAQLGLASDISVNGGGKRKVVPIPSNGGKSGGRAGRGDHVACHFCRGRKLKCDGRRPTCGHCSLRNLACAYDDFIRRRGPGKKEKNSKRSHKSSDVADSDNQSQDRDQNMMLIGPDIAGPIGGGIGAVGIAGSSNQTEILVTVPSQGQPQHASQLSSPLSAIPSSAPAPSSTQQQRRRRRNLAASNAGTSSSQSGTSILRFDAAGSSSSEGNTTAILSSLKPSAVAYAVETNERLPVNVNVGMPSDGMEYYSYHPHHQQHHQHPHSHMSMPYVPPDHAVGYYASQPSAHPTAVDQGPPPPPQDHHYAYNEEKDEEQEEEEGDEDADGDTDGPTMEGQRSQTQQHPAYDPHSHQHHAYAPQPPPWPAESPGAHARVQ